MRTKVINSLLSLFTFNLSLYYPSAIPDQFEYLFHCFGETYETAKQILDLGGFISLTGIITFKKTEELRETIKKIPLTSIMLETDCPYLAPVPYRGKTNEPKYLLEIAKALADIKELPLEKISEITYTNSMEFFNV